MKPLKNLGFTIIETMVAIAILGTMLFAAITLVVQVNESMIYQKRLVGATYLLQECHEMVRNIRDSLWKQNLPWNCAFYQPTGKAFVIANNIPAALTGETPVCLSGTAGSSHLVGSFVNLKAFPTAASGEPFEQKFGGETYERRVTFGYDIKIPPETGCELLTDPGKLKNCSEVKVNCEVSWEARGGRKKVSMVSILTDWFKR